MIQLINNILAQLFKIRINKIPKERKLENKYDFETNGIIVEFVGPPGVGKSTLCREYIKGRNLSSTNQIIKSKEINEYLNSNQIHLSDFRKEILIEYINQYINYNSISEKRLNRLNLYFNHLKIDCLILDLLPNRICFLDQHLLQLFSGLPEWLPADNITNDFLKNRIFINCLAEKEVIFERIKSRNKILKSGDFYNLNDKEIKQKIKKISREHQDKIKHLKNKGASIVNINTNEKFSKNIKIIDDFINLNFP